MIEQSVFRELFTARQVKKAAMQVLYTSHTSMAADGQAGVRYNVIASPFSCSLPLAVHVPSHMRHAWASAKYLCHACIACSELLHPATRSWEQAHIRPVSVVHLPFSCVHAHARAGV